MAPPPRHRWYELTTEEFRDPDIGTWIAVLPIAAVEQHGPHLPVAVDTLLAEGYVARVLDLLPADLPALFLPVQAVGKSNEHISSPGTLTLTWDTAIKAWLDIGDSVARAGIRKLVVITSHGGNVPLMDVISRELRVRHDMLVVATGWSRFGQPAGLYDERELRYGIHGGDIETSMMLALRPDLVRLDKREDFRSTQELFDQAFTHLRAHGPHQFGWKAQDLNVKGTVGDATRAEAAKGRQSLDHAARGFIGLLTDIHAFDPDRLWRPETP
jgi:creatinine amidohydrolase